MPSYRRHRCLLRVAVYWDIENCNIPAHVDGRDFVKGLRALAETYGDVKFIKVFGDMSLSHLNFRRRELVDSDVVVRNTPHRGQFDVADRALITTMRFDALCTFMRRHPSQTTIFLITGDGGFDPCVQELQDWGFRVVVAATPKSACRRLTRRADFRVTWPSDIIDAIPTHEESDESEDSDDSDDTDDSDGSDDSDDSESSDDTDDSDYSYDSSDSDDTDSTDNSYDSDDSNSSCNSSDSDDSSDASRLPSPQPRVRYLYPTRSFPVGRGGLPVYHPAYGRRRS